MFAVINGVEYRRGDYVLVDVEGQLCVGVVDKVDPEDHIGGVVRLVSGGWFCPGGWMNTVAQWKILGKASQEDVDVLPDYADC
jgi:hypothetical protein